MRAVIYILLILIFFCAKDCFAQSKDRVKMEGPIPLDPNVRYGKLENGFTYYIRKNANPENKIYLQLVVKAGYDHEDKDQTGLSHLLEHMGFDGLKHFPGNNLREYFDKSGLLRGGDWNAITAMTYTAYKLIIPSDNHELVNNSMQILRDWAQDITLDPKSVDEERGVILSESRKGHSYSFDLSRKIISKIVNDPEHPENWLLLHDQNIKNFAYESLVRFYKDWYRPDLEAAIVVGDVNVEETEKRIKTLFSNLIMPETPRFKEENLKEVNFKWEGEYLSIPHKEAVNTIVTIYQKRKAFKKTIRTVDEFKNSITEELYDYMIQPRLEHLTQQYNAPIEMVRNEIDDYELRNIRTLRTRIFIPAGKSVEPAVKVVLQELERVYQHGFTEAELGIAKEKVRKECLKKDKTASALLIERYREHFISGSGAPSPDYEKGLMQEILKNITTGDVNTIAKNWIGNTKYRDVVITYPGAAKSSIPNERTFLKWFKDIKSIKMQPHTLTQEVNGSLVKGLDLPGVKAKLLHETYNEEIGLNEIVLPNGIKIILRPFQPKDHTKGMVYLNAFKPGGTQNYGDGDYFSAAYAGSIIKHSGFLQYDKFQIEKLLDGTKISISPEINELSINLKGSFKPEETETMMELVYLNFLYPRKDIHAFEDWISKESQKVNSLQKSFPFENEVNNFINNHDFRKAYLTAENLKKIKFEKVYEIYKENFSKAYGFTFILSGDFNKKEILPYLLKYLGSLHGEAGDNKKPEKYAGQVYDLKGKIFKEYYFGKDQGAVIRLFFPGKYMPSLKNEIKFNLLEQVLKHRMTERLREKESGTYSVATNVLKTRNDFYMFEVKYMVEKDKADKMIQSALEEFRRLRDEGITEAEFRNAKAQVHKYDQGKFGNAKYWSEYLQDQYLNGKEPGEILKKYTMMELITLEEINQAAKEYLKEENIMQFVCYPEGYNNENKVYN